MVFFSLQPSRNHEDWSALQVSFDDKSDFRNNSGNVNYYFEVDLNFWNDW